ncbi:hypothetical protein AAVH_08387 [Aphelenchoides avenae]|nr:hypothetical protein AAVH_08387 [Aphelenchus avenae]
MKDKHLADGGTEREYVVDSILCNFSTEELRDLGKSGFPSIYEDRHDNEVLYWVSNLIDGKVANPA